MAEPTDEGNLADDSTRAFSPQALVDPGKQPLEIGGFRILSKLGEGGMGIVFEAEQQNPRRRVALKVVRGGQFVDEAYLKMFHREEQTLARLAHPNIAAIYQSGRTDDGQHFFTMELVSGLTLNEHVSEHMGGSDPTARDLRARLRLFATVCRAVNYAHQRGVIHRDLKPSNFMVTEEGDVKVLDFGLARITHPDVAPVTVMSEVGKIRGTLAYMSPEQARGDTWEIDSRTDVYALGVVLFELLSGQRPYDLGTTLVQAVQTICEKPPRPLRPSDPGADSIDGDLRTIAEKALEKEPDRRYASAAALADDIERYLANRPILAHPPSTLYQLRKFAARHRVGVGSAAVIAALVIALAGTMIVQAQRVRGERDRATAESVKSSAINTFLQDALGAADPWGKGSRDVSLLEALRQAQAKAESAFQDQPLVHAEVLQSIGTTFTNLAELEDAEKLLQKSLELRRAAAGPRTQPAAESYVALSGLYEAWRKFDDSENNAREAVAINSELFGSDSLQAAASMNFLATAVRRKGRLDESKGLAQNMLEIARSQRSDAGGVDPRQVETYALQNLTYIALEQNDPEAMESTVLDLLSLVRDRHKGNHPEVSQALNDLGTAQVLKGDFEGAEQSYLESLEMGTALLGADHPEVASTRENLGGVYMRTGRLDETAQILEQVLATRREALGDDSEPVARTLANTAFVYMRAGNNEASERTYREAVPRLIQHLGPDHADVGIALACLGEVLRKQSEFIESETTLTRALAVLTNASGEEAPMSQWTLKALANLYEAWEKPEQAAAYAARLSPEPDQS